MIHKTALLVLFAATAATGVIYSTPTTSIGTQTYKFDPNHTTVTWTVNHFGFSEITGKCLAEGTLTLDPVHVQNSKLAIKINISKMVTGIPALDDVLRGTNFFSVEKYGVATFTSNAIQQTSKNTGIVKGILTIRGITKPVTLNVKLNKQDMHPFFRKEALGFSASATIKRSDYEMTGYTPDVSDEVRLNIQAEAELTQ